MRLFAIVLALLTALLRVNPRSGALHIALWLAKLLATGLVFPMALLNGWMVGLGVKRRDWLLLLAGGTGGAIAAHHLITVTRSRDDQFAEAFGDDWQQQLSPSIKPLLRKRRWRPLFYRRFHGVLRENVSYGRNPDSKRPLYADILTPPDTVPRSGLALIYVHGGAWTFGRRNIRKFPYFRQLARQGHLIMDIDYTLSSQTSLIGMAMDVKRAIIWLKAHADEYAIDPDRIVMAGQSAGGHLSLLAAYTPNLPALQPPEMMGDTSVCGVLSFYGPPDMKALHSDMEEKFLRRLSPQVKEGIAEVVKRTQPKRPFTGIGVSALMGGSPAEIPDVYRLLSPIVHVDADCPPTLLLHGDHDGLVSARETAVLYKKLREVGVTAVYLNFPDCEHSFESTLPQLSPAAKVAAYYTERFLALL